MDGADQRRPHRLRGLSAVLTVFVAPPTTIAAADDRQFQGQIPAPGATLSISGRLCYQAGRGFRAWRDPRDRPRT
jgi:hypothetical protein